MLLLLALGCDFSAATGITPVDTAGGADSAAGDDSGAGPDTDPGETDADPDDTAPPSPYATDDDGDDWSEDDGDCDDEDPTVFPGATDTCNGEDDDCDEDVDEDAEPDGYEPNDTSAVSIGSLDEDSELTAVATLSGDADVDRFSFDFTDSGWSLFTIEASLTGIPDDATYRFTLNRLASDGDEPAEEIDQVFGSGSLAFTLSDEVLVEDGGTYELVVEAVAGADCGRTYLVAVAW